MTDNSHLCEFTDIEIEEFNRTLRDAYNEPWWKNFVDLIRQRRERLLEELAAGEHEQRTEDRIRGQISECANVIALNYVGKNLQRKEEERHAREQRKVERI